jgi:hypothetical protein
VTPHRPKALVLIRNFQSNAERLDFGDFTISKVASHSEHFQNVFLFRDVQPDDWLLEKPYAEMPPGLDGSTVGGVPDDIEDLLLLFRLYKHGEIAFIRLAVDNPKAGIIVQTYRAMNDLNSNALPKYDLQAEEYATWKTFVNDLQQRQAWTSDWFGMARRFFLLGGAKQFNPIRNDIDRMVDYATALEAVLVPDEDDFITSRMSHRAAVLLLMTPEKLAINPEPDDQARTKPVVEFMRMFYKVRSRIVHGDRLDDSQRDWLSNHSVEIERRVRDILAAAIRFLPSGEQERGEKLAELYAPTDEERGRFALDKFRKIQTDEVRKTVSESIAKMARRKKRPSQAETEDGS